MDNLIDGVVLTFADVTERVQAIASRKARDIAEVVVDTVNDPLVVLDGGLQVLSANRAFHREFGGNAQATVGRPFFEIGNRQWDFPALHDLLETMLPTEGSFVRQPVEHDFPGQGLRHLKLSARRIAEPAGSGDLVLLAIEIAAADPERRP
jgi:two-component system CheB/CheR fusion protein